MPRSVSVLLIIAVVLTVWANALPSRQRIGQLIEQSDYDLISTELRLASETEPTEFANNDFDYLFARIEEKRGDFASAAQNFHAAGERDRVLRPYALKHLSQIMRSTGNLAFERLFLREIIFSETNKILDGPARIRLIRNYFESGEFASVTDSVNNGFPGSSDPTSGEIGRDMLLLMGNSYLKARKFKEAREVYEDLISSVPDPDQPDDFALEAVKGLDILNNGDSKLGVEVANLSVSEHKRRAGIYQFNRNFLLARLHYTAICENHEDDDGIPEAMYQIARGYDQQRKYTESLEWYRKILDRYPEDDLSALALYGTAGSYANLDDTEKAVAAYKKYIEENPRAGNLERAHLNIVDAYRDSGDDNKALEWSANIQKLFAGKMGEATALFADARIYISGGKWDRALEALHRLRGMKDLGGNRIAGGTNSTEVEFLTALVFEKLGRVEQAIETYLKIPDGRDEYYGWRATVRLGLLANSPKHKKAVLSKVEELKSQRKGLKPEAALLAEQNLFRLTGNKSRESIESIYRELKDYSGIPELQIKHPELTGRAAHKLLGLALYDEAAPEIEAALRKTLNQAGEDLSDFEEDTSFTLAVYYQKGGFADRSIRFIEPKWKRIPRDYEIELIPEEQAVFLYPAPFRDELLKYGKKENVDPRFVLSIMRQESRFRTDIKSAAAARGLMQFISSTSRIIARELDIEEFSRDDLYDPDTSIRFGARYLAILFKQFPDQPQAVAASYNGGEDRLERWLKRSKTNDPDRYVPEIAFTQTKDYVYRVMANYRMYINLYDENLELRSEAGGR